MHDVAKGISNLTVQSKVKPRRRRGLGIAMGLLIAILIFVLGIKALQIGKMMSSPKMMPAVTVTSASVKEEDWPPKLSAVGSVSAAQGAVVSAELAGIVSEISFESGAEAKKGDGQLGIRQVNVGQMINAGQQVVGLTSLDSLYVDFALPEQHLSKLKKDLEVRVRADALPGREFKGKLTAINSMLDPVTRNVPLQATFENPDHALHPGMFAKVEVMLPETKKTIVIPGAAVSYAPYGDSVFVIEKQKDPKSGKESLVLRQQFVRIGEVRGDFVSVLKGLKAGEEVVGTGVFKLRNGMVVTINNDLAPKPELNPNPADT